MVLFLRTKKKLFTLPVATIGIICLWSFSNVLEEIFSEVFNGKHSLTATKNENYSLCIDENFGEVTSRMIEGQVFFHVDEWKSDDFCLSSLQDVYWHPLFPSYPFRQCLKSNIEGQSVLSSTSAIRRVLFLICPPTIEKYQFFIAVKGGFDMFVFEWTREELAENSTLIYRFHMEGYADREKTFKSEWLNLDSKKVYKIDLVHWMKHDGAIKIQWRIGSNGDLQPITRNDVCSRYYNGINLGLQHRLPLSPLTPGKKKALENPLLWFYEKKQHTLGDFQPNLEECSYTPSYIIKGHVQRDTGWSKIKVGSVFPYYPLLTKDNGKLLLPEQTAKDITMQAFKVIQASKCRFCQMKNLVVVEENAETNGGHRYFVEMDVEDLETNLTLRISDYVYRKAPNTPICHPKDFIWRANVDVYVVFTTSEINKRWTLFFLDTMSKIINQTEDYNVKVWFAAYGVNSLDYERILQERNLEGKVFCLTGKFNKVKGLNQVIRGIPDQNSIIFTVDLHLDVPIHIIDQVRKNTILGKTVYAPELVRLDCGKHPEYTDPGNSFWIFNGFGVVSAYKADWDIIGGMNEKLFGTKWGGEDWELMDRVISKGYEVIRRRLSRFYHIYHSRKGTEWYA